MKKLIFLLLVLFLSAQLNSQISVEFDLSESTEVNNLTGFNTGFNHRHWVEKSGAGNHDVVYSQAIRQDLVQEMIKLSSPVLRFPGGVIANFYHLYPEGNTCSLEDQICEEDFAKGYGLRTKETETHFNGLGPVNGAFAIESENGNVIPDNWIVTFADLAEEYETQTGKRMPIVLMLNVVSHFKFKGQSAQFTGDSPNVDDQDFQVRLRESAHALRYLINERGLNVVGVELGTELYFPTWSRNNDMTIEKFINLIPVYHDMLEEEGFGNLEIGVPFHLEHSLGANAGTWSRKLADASNNPNQMYDAWIVHDYQRFVDPCINVFNSCGNCDWVHDECSLYTENVNNFLDYLDCEPEDHKPMPSDLTNVFNNKRIAFAQHFNNGLAEEYEVVLNRLRELSGKEEAKFWLTEWNFNADSGCDQWKGANRFYTNTFLHSVSVFEILQSLNHKNMELDNGFIKFSNFHSFGAPNYSNPIINAGAQEISLNSTFYPFEFNSIITDSSLAKINMNYSQADYPYENGALHAYIDKNTAEGENNIYLFYSNKTTLSIPLDLNNAISEDTLMTATINYIQGDKIYTAANADYTYKTNNIVPVALDVSHASDGVNLIGNSLPPLSFGYVHLKYKKKDTGIDDPTSIPSFKVYPNPADDVIHIGFSNHSIKASYEVELVDYLGQKIATLDLIQNEQINTLSYHEGLYFINLVERKTRRVVQSKKILILH